MTLIAPPSLGPTMTSILLEREQDHDLRRYFVDPLFELPKGTPPVAVSGGASHAVRAASWWLTPLTFAQNFVGFAKETFEAGEEHSIWVAKHGIVRMKLKTAAAVQTGDLFKFTTEDITYLDNPYTVVSNNTVEPYTLGVDNAAEAIFEAIEDCACVDVTHPKCPPNSAVPADTTATDSDPPTRPVLRVVRLAFNVS